MPIKYLAAQLSHYIDTIFLVYYEKHIQMNLK